VDPGPHLVGGDTVELLTDGTAAARRLGAAIVSARRSVDAEIYEFDREDLLRALVQASRRGVRVRVIYDPSVAADAPTVANLREAGAEVVPFPVGRMQIDHVKLLLVDSRLAFFGGMNWGRNSYLNHDFEVAVTGPAVASLREIYAADLVRSGVRLASTPRPATAPGAPLRIVTSYPADEVRPEVLRAVSAARRYIFIEMFAMTDSGVIAALGQAVSRGVSVFVLLDPSQHPNRRTARLLRQAGVSCRFYAGHGEKLHAKAAVFDGTTLVVGSANWSRSGFTRNHELDAVIVDTGIAGTALARMERDWGQTPADFRSR
jgi:cardiolipin synthase